MRSSIVAAICSMLALGGLVAAGLDVPDEGLVYEVRGGDDGATSDVAAQDRGPSALAAVSGPRAPSVPALALRSASPTTTTPAVLALPVRVRVPAIDIDAPVVTAGVDDEGSLEVPDPRQVGWYEHGPIPGEEGAAVLAAHVDLGHVAGIFYHLDDVLLGDRVYIDYDDGSTQVFEVVDDVLYAKTALPADELFRRTGDPVLHLVTCGGVFDPETHHYLGNRVVTARPVD